VTYSKEKIKENFGYACVHRQQYPKGKDTQKVSNKGIKKESGMNTAPFLEYSCFITNKFNTI
jgi:hypothetical protein